MLELVKNEDKTLLSKEGKILVEAVEAIKQVIAENVKAKRALCELDTGGGDYFTARQDIAELSGMPTMAISWSKHLKIIKDKLNIWKCYSIEQPVINQDVTRTMIYVLQKDFPDAIMLTSVEKETAPYEYWCYQKDFMESINQEK